jgi:16S rRNA G966 N2-methylase RsmD
MLLDGLPYMGSKRTLSKEIIDFVLLRNPNCKYVYDLFGGGGAISLEASKREQIKQVFYNELNTGIVNLFLDLKDDQLNKMKYFQWIDRDTYNIHRYGDDWYSGLLKCCWSFGNKQETYIYGKHIEEIKRALHYLIVDRDEKSFNYLVKVGIYPSKNIFNLPTVEERRMLILRETKSRRDNVVNIIRVQHLTNINNVLRSKPNDKITFYNKSFEDVEITTPIDETVIILDPPYKGTSCYQKILDHNLLYDYIRSSPYIIYICEYDCPFYLVKTWVKRSTLSSRNNVKMTNENLYSNKEEKYV